MDVGRFLDIAVNRYPDKLALVFKENRWTYRHIHERVGRLSSALQNLGIRKGDRVSTAMWNSSEMLEIYLASARIGAIFTPYNFRLTKGEMAYVIGDSEPAILFMDEKCRDVALEAAAGEIPLDRLYMTSAGDHGDLHSYDELLKHSPISDQPAFVNGNDPCQLLYTSGTTTGKPKGVILSHDNICWNSLCISTARRDRDDDVHFVAGPLFHTVALNSVFTSRLSRCNTVILHERFDPLQVMKAVDQEKVTVLSLAPTMFIMLMEACKPGDYETSSVTALSSGGDKLPIAVQKALREYFPNIRGIYDIYGLTECPNVTCLHCDLSIQKFGSIGLPLPYVEMKLLDHAGKEVEQGQVGEIVIRGPNMLQGYYKQPEATAEAVKDGWFHTGDAARTDEEGYIYLADRIKDIIISGGENIASREVEEIIYKHPDVVKVACFAAPDEKWVERIVAAIIPKEGKAPTLEEIREHCRKDLAGYKLPREIMIVDKMPETPTGKIQKFELKRIHRERQSGKKA